MDILEQCQIWNEQEEYRKIIDALEAVPDESRSPEMDSELARAYNNAAGPEDRELYERAIALLKPHEAYFEGDHCWNFRMGYAWYYLDQEGPALHYFERALEARPGDEDTQELIDDCRERLALPRFEQNFRRRTEDAWAAFAEVEAELRRAMDTGAIQERGGELLKTCGAALALALCEPAFEIGFNGEKYELILSPEGSRAGLFPLVYFQRRAPEAVLEHWNIHVGRQPSDKFELRSGPYEVRAGEVQVWVQRQEEGQVSLTLRCEKLLPLLKSDPDRAWWLLSTLTDQVLGEVSAIALICGFQVTEAPMDGSPIPLSLLPETIQSMGLPLWGDAGDYLENCCLDYNLEPAEDPEADWRLDVYAGSTRLPALIHDYMAAQSGTVDDYHRDGIAAGFLCLPLDGSDGGDGAQQAAEIRDTLRAAILEKAGAGAVTFLGEASGLYCSYLDFIAWDLPAVLQAAAEIARDAGLAWASFHSFRRDVATVRLFSREEEGEPPIHEETGSLLSPRDLETLESFVEEATGYYGRMFQYLRDFVEQGVRAGAFTENQARQDLQLALWYAFACNNLDEYEFYYRAAQWMPGSECSAGGCGAWYYRYSVALMYCGRLEEARRYAELGAGEEPDYPWIWLQAGKLRSHFGDRAGALEAVARGLALEPGDYEFLTLEREIRAGASLEEMEYHWINPEADRRLQQGLDQDADDKLRAISCITVDEAGLARFLELFRPDPEHFSKNDPYCSFEVSVLGHQVEVVFQMNEAGLSKLNAGWLQTQKERLDDGRWLAWSAPEGESGCLDAVLFGLDCRVCLIYRVEGERTRYFRVWLNEDGTPNRCEEDEDLSASRSGGPEEIYSEAEMEIIEGHIQQYFGKFENVFHELVSPDIHVDICVVPPSEERNYWTLVTMGMGAHRMNVPEDLAEHKLERAELAIALPPDWKLEKEDLSDEQWYWPIRLLKVLARLPIHSDTWLGWGHTIDNQEPFADNTQLCAAMLTAPQRVEEGGEVCPLPDGGEVNFYQVIPLYRDELGYKMARDAGALLERMEGLSFVVDPARPDALAWDGAQETAVLDDGTRHLEKIRDKKLPVEELAAFNHLAIFLRWCMEHDLMSLDFLERYGGLAQRFQEDLSHLDLRPFIRDELGGQLVPGLFDEEGERFARQYYCQGGLQPCYPGDIDAHALEYFGPDRCNAPEFQGEAYLFVPFDEDYYQAMAAVIQARRDG